MASPPPLQDLSKTTSDVFTILEHNLPASHIREYPHALARSQDDVLLMHVKQYVPRHPIHPPQKGDITIIGAHANGFAKELYEPFYEDFLDEAQKRGIGIRSIIIADCPWQGQSGIINADLIGNDPGWHDYARDILHMINTLRPPRPIMAMGHSFGGNALTNVALMHPRLFSGMALLDPVIARFRPVYVGPAQLSINRRDVWPSRQAAVDAFRKNRFYQTWDPRVLDRWINFGIRPLDGDPEKVQLTTTKHQEVFTFLRPAWPAYDASGTKLVRPDLVPDLVDPVMPATHRAVYRPEGVTTVDRLPNVRPGVLYVFGGKSEVSLPHLCDEKLEITGTGLGGSGGRAANRVTSVTEPDTGHLIPMEQPRWTARVTADWAATELARWRDEDREFEAWAALPRAEQVLMTEEYKRKVGPPPSKAPPKAKI